MTDTIKLVATYATAIIVIVGGGLMLFVSRNEVNSDFALLAAGFVGSAMAFMFGQESATRAVRSYQKGIDANTEPPA